VGGPITSKVVVLVVLLDAREITFAHDFDGVSYGIWRQELDGGPNLDFVSQFLGVCRRLGVSRRIFLGLGVMTISSAPFRHDVVFLQEHSAPTE
jgi:hypothetical protein